jgi:hypothetical protein
LLIQKSVSSCISMVDMVILPSQIAAATAFTRRR